MQHRCDSWITIFEIYYLELFFSCYFKNNFLQCVDLGENTEDGIEIGLKTSFGLRSELKADSQLNLSSQVSASFVTSFRVGDFSGFKKIFLDKIQTNILYVCNNILIMIYINPPICLGGTKGNMRLQCT